MPIQTLTIDLGDGDSAEMYQALRHGTSKAIQEIYRPEMNKPKVIALLNSKDDEKARLAKLFKIVGKTADIMGANEVLILGQVKSWSFGEITQAVLDDIPEEKVELLLLEANKLYGEVPLAEGGVRK